jgi:hypothetical protein
VINAGDEGRLGTDKVAEFIRHGGEDLGWAGAASYQSGHAPQRRLRIRELAQPRRLWWVMACCHVGARVWRVHELTVARCSALQQRCGRGLQASG